MIIHDSIEFHNVAELVPCEHPRGFALYRYPREVREHLSTLGHHAAASADGVELRFTGSAGWVSLTLSAQSNYPFSEGARVRVYRGDILVEETTIPDGATRTLTLNEPPLVSQVTAAAFARARFPPEVWRVVFAGGTIIYHGIDAGGAALRSPTAGERPTKRWLAYGSSITNSTPGYVEHAATLAGLDIMNKGLAGSCLCEPEVAAWLPECEAWDLASLELGVNMRGSFTVAQFESRARTVVESFRAAAHGRPIVLIDIFPNSDDYLTTPGPNTAANREFRAVVHRIHEEAGDANVHLIRGEDVLTSFSGLSADLIHPSASGHHLMGSNLARILGDRGML